jgi:CubicO group peptidase (beta-lactamase class C family)
MTAARAGLVLSAALLLAQAGRTGTPFAWQKASPESQGMSSARLDALRAALARKQTKALLIVRNDRIVLEWYAPGHSATAKHYTASLAKALVAGLSLAVALDDKRIALDDPVAKYIPAWKNDSRKRRITVRQLGSHTSGLDDAHQEGVPHEKLPGWMGDFWKRKTPPDDPFTISRDRTPLRFEPGRQLHYSNPGIALLTCAVTAALKGGPHRDVRALLRERVLRPIGVEDSEWSIGYGQTFTVDGLPLVPSWGGGAFTARAAARVGRQMLRGGDWDGKPLIGAAAVRQVTQDAGTPGPCGMGWWSNNEGQHPRLPRDAFWGSGAGHQILLVVPSLNLVVVRNGAALGASKADPASFHELARRHLFDPLMDALTAAPYPPSSVIAGITWAPKETIVRQAQGSDNWPITWGADDHLHTAYGDGNGFKPFVPAKLSLGFARVEGGPVGFRGVNVRSDAEQKGDGKAGKKASGMLSVGGVLYLWVRNAGNAQLAWSADRGKTWTWADWKLTAGFGCPTFLQFGKDYAGARDGFVYIYSPDSDSAYEPADRMVLARVPKDEIRKRSAYEFFAGLDARGNPTWTEDVAKRGAVFAHRGRCWRSGISYNAALKRYLWCQVHPESRDRRGPRFEGGFAIYDAPQPWGPWTTAFRTEAWDVGPGETSSFPTKWMSPDGKSAYLVFSGDDCFSVRKATLALVQQAYFPPPESKGGWRKLTKPEDVRTLGGMDPAKLADLERWLLRSDKRKFAALVIRHGHVVLEVERGNSAKTHTGNVKSCAKAICATVLAIASEESQKGNTPRKMRFTDPAFDFLPWAKPLSDPRKAKITVQQLLNHTSGICPEATGAPNDGKWEYVLGHSGDARTAKLAFDPGTACGYSTHALHHAALVCENVTGMPYDTFTIKNLFEPIGVERWWFQHLDEDKEHGRHPSHALGLPARDLARVAYCMLRGGRWGEKQVIPKWFVAATAAPTHEVKTAELRFKVPAQTFSHGWELPARLTGSGGRSGQGIPADARAKPGSGGQLIAFVPGLDLVVVRQTGSSGGWEYEEFLRRACQAVLP